MRFPQTFANAIDALAWRGMQAIARRQEGRLQPRLPALPADFRGDARELFPAPPPPDPNLMRGDAWQRRSGFWRRDFAFPSRHYSPFAANDVVYVRSYAGERALHLPAVIVLHGLMNFTMAAYRPLLRGIVDAGAAAYLLELPYHHRRTPSGSLSGDLFHTIDLELTLQAVQQSVGDLQQLALHLRNAGAPRLGLLGLSLGAWIGGLAICCGTELDFAVLGMPPSDLNALVWRSVLGTYLRRRFALQGWSPELTAGFYRWLDPLAYRPLLPPESIQFYAAAYDTLVPLSQVEILRQAWSGPALRVYRHGHLSIMISPQMHRDFARDLAAQLQRKPRRETTGTEAGLQPARSRYPAS